MAVQKAVAEKWKQVTNRPLIEAYGLTETSPAACINPMSLKDYNGFIGLPIPSTEVEIKDDNGKTLPLGEIGEICIRGPQVMAGYYNRPDETAKVMTQDGFFKTGDLGFMTEQGYSKIVDRKKDMIVVAGFKVFPNEIEEVISCMPGVRECAVIGIPHRKLGEIVKAYIVKDNSELTEAQVIQYCKEQMTSYKRPRKIAFIDEMPKSNVGKILRRHLRDL
jgi:long-chain acyl-CoA synthetase